MLTTDAEDAEVKIVDFGFAATDVHGNHLIEQLGTPAYIAPEILNHQRYGSHLFFSPHKTSITSY